MVSTISSSISIILSIITIILILSILSILSLLESLLGPLRGIHGWHANHVFKTTLRMCAASTQQQRKTPKTKTQTKHRCKYSKLPPTKVPKNDPKYSQNTSKIGKKWSKMELLGGPWGSLGAPPLKRPLI